MSVATTISCLELCGPGLYYRWFVLCVLIFFRRSHENHSLLLSRAVGLHMTQCSRRHVVSSSGIGIAHNACFSSAHNNQLALHSSSNIRHIL